MIDGTILIALITKNSNKWISDVLLNVEKYASFFSSYNTLIVDGYSTDNTKDISDFWCSRDPINRTFLLQATKNLNRMDSITEARNTVINYYKSVFGKNVYLLLLDSDSPNQGPFNEIGFLSSFTCDFPWVGMFPNQVIKLSGNIEQDMAMLTDICKNKERFIKPIDVALIKKTIHFSNILDFF